MKASQGYRRITKTVLISWQCSTSAWQWRKTRFSRYISRRKWEKRQNSCVLSLASHSLALALGLTMSWFSQAVDTIPHIGSWACYTKAVLGKASVRLEQKWMENRTWQIISGPLPDWKGISGRNPQGLSLAWHYLIFSLVFVDWI